MGVGVRLCVGTGLCLSNVVSIDGGMVVGAFL